MGYKSWIPKITSEIDDADYDALRLIRGQIEGEAKRLAPVDVGRLRQSITGENDKETAVVGTDVEYATYQELGTEKMSANPFLQPAAEKNSSLWADIIRKHYGRIRGG